MLNRFGPISVDMDEESPRGVTGRPCLSCHSSDLPEIDAAIRSGVPLNQIARRFGIDRSAIGRHARHHVPGYVGWKLVRG